MELLLWVGNHFCFLYHVISTKSLRMLVYRCLMTAVVFLMKFFYCEITLDAQKAYTDSKSWVLALFYLVIYLLIFGVLGIKSRALSW